MSLVATAPTAPTRPLTASEFFEWVHRPENRNRFFELDSGEVVEMPPPGKLHGFVCGNVAGILRNFAIQRRKGYVCTNDAGVIVERDPDTVRGPDVTFYEDAQTIENMDRQYADRPPVLAVEVLSPDDRVNRVIRRITQMLHAGVGVVWLVDPEGRDVSVNRPGQDPILVREEQELSGDPALPDFRCRVADFFAVPGM
jgi:Uma2 family endonuclease